MKLIAFVSMFFALQTVQATGPDTTSWEIIHQATKVEWIGGQNIECVPIQERSLSQMKITLSNGITLTRLSKKCHASGKGIKARQTSILYLETPIDYFGNPTGEPPYLTCFISLLLEDGTHMTSGYWTSQSESSCK